MEPRWLGGHSAAAADAANGIVFMLLEDEFGQVILVVPPQVYERPPSNRARLAVSRREDLGEGRANMNVVVGARDPRPDRANLGAAELVHRYGSTTSAPLSSLRPRREPRICSEGRPRHRAGDGPVDLVYAQGRASSTAEICPSCRVPRHCERTG